MDAVNSIEEYREYLLTRFKEEVPYDDIVSVLESTFPGRWEFNVDTTLIGLEGLLQNRSGFSFPVDPKEIIALYSPFVKAYVHFPSVEVDNDYTTHTIEDLYVGILWKIEGRDAPFRLFPALEGFRTSFTKEEVDSNFTHPHLSTLDYNYMITRRNSDGTFLMSNFCIGDGPLYRTMAELKNNWDSQLFKLMMYEIKELISWESIEGSPYISIEDIGSRGDEYLEDYYDPGLSQSGAMIILQRVKPELEVEGDLVAPNFRFSDPQLLIDIGNRYGYPPVYRVGTDYYVYTGSYDNGNYSDGIEPIFTFKGEDIHFKLLTNEQIREEQRNLIPNPKFIEKLQTEPIKRNLKRAAIASFDFKNDKDTSYYNY